jgi:hypothetical protein
MMITTVTIIREIEIEVDVKYMPAVRATHMQPSEPADVEILEAYDELGQSVEITDSEEERVRQMVLASPPERDCD